MTGGITAPTVQYLVAFNNNGDDDPGLITTVASPAGTLGANNVWTDITHWVTHDDGTRGRQAELQQFQAGVRTLTLRNDDGRFTPWNTSSPYTGKLLPRKPVQVRAAWLGVTYYRFTGQAFSWQPNWPDAFSQTAGLSCADAYRMFQSADLTTNGYAAQIVADGATAYWPMNDPVGSGIVNDAVATFDGHWFGTPTFGVAGPFPANPANGTQLGTSTTPSAYASLSTCPINLSGNLTMGAWVQVTAAPPFNSIALTLDQTSGSGFAIYVNSSGFAGMIGTAGTSIAGATNICDGNWHFIVGTCTSAGASTLYVDGVSVNTGTVFNNASTGTFGYIGGTAGGVPQNYGNLAQVFCAQAVLTGAQITALYNLAAFPQESTNARITRVLNSIGWSAGARALDSGVSTVQAQTSTLTTTSALSHLQSVEATEGGALFIGATGKVTFYSRDTLVTASWTSANQATFGDNTGGGDIPFQVGPTISLDDIYLYNEASANRNNGNTQTTDNQTSINIYGRNTWNPPSTLLGISDAEVLGLTQFIVTKYANPVTRLASITIDVAAVANDFPAAVPALLTLELLYQVLVERTIMPGGGTAFSQIGDIQQIAETIDAAAGTWTMTFQMSPPDQTYWVLGSSQLGTNTAIYW